MVARRRLYRRRIDECDICSRVGPAALPEPRFPCPASFCR
jgi:hypothetical protein